MRNEYQVNIDAEEGLIACLLYDQDSQDEFLPRVNEVMFVDSIMREACVLMKRLSSNGEVVDVATVFHHGSSNFQMEFPLRIENRRGQIGYFSTRIATDYFRIIETDSAVRQAIVVLNTTVDKLSQSSFSSKDEVLSVVSSISDSITSGNDLTGNVKNSKELADNFYLRISEARQNYESGKAIASIPTGFIELDKHIGGLKPAQMIVIGAQPGVGKTSFALNLAENLSFCKEKRKVLFFSLEMTEEQIINRIACVHMQVDTRALEQPHLLPEHKLSSLGDAAAKIADSMFFLYDDGSSDADYLISIIRKLVHKEHIDVVIIDYLQLIEGAKSKKSDNRVYELSRITRSLKNITRELKIPVILLSQLNRDIEKRSVKVPQLSDLRDSGSIEQDADIVMFINRNFADEEEMREKDLKLNEAMFYIRKHRNGPRCAFKLGFLEKYTRFENIKTN